MRFSLSQLFGAILVSGAVVGGVAYRLQVAQELESRKHVTVKVFECSDGVVVMPATHGVKVIVATQVPFSGMTCEEFQAKYRDQLAEAGVYVRR